MREFFESVRVNLYTEFRNRAGSKHSSLSSLMTLESGNILATGTPSGVGFKRTPPLFLRDGDVIEVEIERIGRLRNPVKRGE